MVYIVVIGTRLIMSDVRGRWFGTRAAWPKKKAIQGPHTYDDVRLYSLVERRDTIQDG